MSRCAVVLVTACTNDPSLQVMVEHDPGIAPSLARTVVSIYQAPDLACPDIEFGDASDDELRGALVTEAASGEPLVGIPRTDVKLVVARGYATDGALVAAGCTDKGDVTGDEQLVVKTVPTATVTVGVDVTETQRGLIVTATDATNGSIDGRPVYWRLFGAAGTSADPAHYRAVSDGVWEPLAPTCTTEGDAPIRPMPPTLPGGFALQVRVSWAASRPRLFSAFTPIDKSAPVTVAADTDPQLLEMCALQRRGTTVAIACMTSATETRTYGYDAATRSVAGGSPATLPALAAPDRWIGVVSVDEPSGDKNVYAISNRGTWAPVNNAPAATAGSWCGGSLPLRCDPDASTFVTTKLELVPACGSSPAVLLAHSTDGPGGSGTRLRTMPIRGGAASEFAIKDGVIVGAGCVTELQPDATSQLRQVVIVEIPRLAEPAITSAVFACSATRSPCIVPLQSSGQAMTFSTGAEPALIATTFDATGAQLAHWVMQPAFKNDGTIGIKDRLVERKRQAAAAPPAQLVTGRFDSDADQDLLWTFASRSGFGIQVAYAREVLGAPLSAILDVAPLSQPAQLFAADFNADGYDEVVFVVTTVVANATVTSLVVAPTGLPYSPAPVPVDDLPCP